MKFLVVLVFLVLAVCNVRADVTKEEVIAATTECKDEAGASDADVEAMANHQPAISKEGKCMLACTLKKFGVLSDEGKMVKDVAIELAQHFIKDEEKKNLAVEIIETCEALDVDDDHCEAAEEYGQCVRAEFQSKGIEEI